MEQPRPEDHVGAYSRPSELRITDLRAVTVGWGGWRFPLIRIDTNQGLSGIGEVRDGASKTFALMLKSRIAGENPCNVERVFRKIKQFGGHARQAGGVCAVEMALMDLAGKAYGVPAYVLAGGKHRDAIRMYCDTPNEPTGEAMGHKLKERMARGFTMLIPGPGVGGSCRRCVVRADQRPAARGRRCAGRGAGDFVGGAATTRLPSDLAAPDTVDGSQRILAADPDGAVAVAGLWGHPGGVGHHRGQRRGCGHQ